MPFKLGHRELLSYLAPLKPCSADASHALLRLRLIGLGTTEPPPFDGAGRPRRNACALRIRDRSSRCIYAQKCLVEVLCQIELPICRAMRFRDHAALQPSARSFAARLAWAAMGTWKAARKCMGTQNMYMRRRPRLAMVYAVNICA
jgi:hypothetical protein